MNYYNEHDKFAAKWIRNLIAAKLIPQGEVDERDIEDVQADDISGFKQCHFFAGIAGWSLALKLAGWPDDQEVWTGSCPCQPFSVAGGRKGTADERHLWPEFYRLIRERKPSCVFGEQVVNAIPQGWLDEVFSDMETEGYACAASVLPAYAVEAHHAGARIFFVAAANGKRFEGCGSKIEKERPKSIISEVSSTFPEWPELEKQLSTSIIRAGDDGVPSRVGRLRAYGNAIVPQLAAEFIKAYMEIMNGFEN